MPCLKEISLNEIGFPKLNLAMSANAITAYLPLLDNFIFSAIIRLYIYPSILVKFIKYLKTCILSLNFDRKHNSFFEIEYQWQWQTQKF